MSDIDEICQQEGIIPYLESRGIQLQRVGKRHRCTCPLPGHTTDKTPSFYVTTKPDGTQLYYCFGCDNGGSILNLVKEMEKKPIGQVIRELKAKHGIKGTYDPKVKVDPLQYEVLADFCTEDEIAMHITRAAKEYIRARGGHEDAVNKVCRLYKRMDEMVARGDEDGLYQILEDAKLLLLSCRSRDERRTA